MVTHDEIMIWDRRINATPKDSSEREIVIKEFYKATTSTPVWFWNTVIEWFKKL